MDLGDDPADLYLGSVEIIDSALRFVEKSIGIVYMNLINPCREIQQDQRS